MPARSAVEQLPDDVRRELERRLVAGGFSGYVALADWLAEQGFAISKSSLHRYGQQFEDRLDGVRRATEQAKAVVEASEDDEGALSDALIRVVQSKTMELLYEIEGPHDMAKIGRMAAQLARASVSQKKWAAEARERARVRLNELEREVDEDKLDPQELIRRVREDVYGIYD